MSFQSQLKKFRERAGFSQAKDFAEEMGIPYTRYISYESKGSEPKYDLLCKIANRLNVTLDELLDNLKDEFEYYKNLVESNRGFLVDESGDKIVIVRRYTDEIKQDLKKEIIDNRLDDYFDIDKILDDNKCQFDSREEFIDFVKDYDAYFNKSYAKCHLWNDRLEIYFGDKQLERIVYKNINVEMTYDQIQRLPSYLFCECVSPSEKYQTEEGKRSLAESVKTYNANFRPGLEKAEKKERLLFSVPHQLKKLLVEAKRTHRYK